MSSGLADKPTPCDRDLSDMLVTIVIVSWNTREYLSACLRSVAAASRAIHGSTQTIVVDNNSTDGTSAMLRREFPWVTVIANTTNRGFAAASNQAIHASSGRYVLLLNPDTEVEPPSLGCLVEFLDRHQRVGAVGPKIVGADGQLQASCFPLPTVTREIWRLFHLDRLWPLSSYPLSQWERTGPRRVEAIQGSCLLVRRSILERVGALDERFFIYTEEVDLCRSMHDAGWALFWVPEAAILHHGGMSTRLVARKMFLELYRSKVEYFRKHTGVWAARLYKLVLFAAAVPRVISPALLCALRPSRRHALSTMVGNYSALLSALPRL